MLAYLSLSLNNLLSLSTMLTLSSFPLKLLPVAAKSTYALFLGFLSGLCMEIYCSGVPLVAALNLPLLLLVDVIFVLISNIIFKC
jgi:hypothetical protein